MIYLVTATITSIWSNWLQQLSRLYDLPCYSNYHVSMIYMVTTTITSTWSILLQQLSRLYDLSCYSNYHVFMIYMVTAPITSICPCYSNYHVYMIYLVTATITSSDLICHSNYYVLWLILLQPITSSWSLYPVNVRHAPITATGGPPPDAPYQERPGGRHAKQPRLCLLCYHIVFSVLPFVLFDICRTEDHKPRGRASDVSTISTCVFLSVMIYCPLPHPISVRTGWGYHCSVLVRLLALFLLN